MNKEPRYIVVEGPIGVGKTTMAQMLAVKLNARVMIERADENPFLHDFYLNMERYAFQTQLHFMLSRVKQQEELSQGDLFHQYTVSDYLFAKDRIFAQLTLSPAEFTLYDQVYEHVVERVQEPDLVVYLYASIERLITRVNKRQKGYEEGIAPEYLERVAQAYNEFFFNYQDTPLLMVNTDAIDFVERPDDFVELYKKIMSIKGGVHHFAPTSGLPFATK